MRMTARRHFPIALLLLACAAGSSWAQEKPPTPPLAADRVEGREIEHEVARARRREALHLRDQSAEAGAPDREHVDLGQAPDG